MKYLRYEYLQKYVKGEPRDEYMKGNFIDVADDATGCHIPEDIIYPIEDGLVKYAQIGAVFGGSGSTAYRSYSESAYTYYPFKQAVTADAIRWRVTHDFKPALFTTSELRELSPASGGVTIDFTDAVFNNIVFVNTTNSTLRAHLTNISKIKRGSLLIKNTRDISPVNGVLDLSSDRIHRVGVFEIYDDVTSIVLPSNRQLLSEFNPAVDHLVVYDSPANLDNIVAQVIRDIPAIEKRLSRRNYRIEINMTENQLNLNTVDFTPLTTVETPLHLDFGFYVNSKERKLADYGVSFILNGNPYEYEYYQNY